MSPSIRYFELNNVKDALKHYSQILSTPKLSIHQLFFVYFQIIVE